MGKHPFQFGQLMDSQSFVNRKTDLERLHRNLSQGIHSVLIAPRRWGKSSLVNELAVRYKSPELVFAKSTSSACGRKMNFLKSSAGQS